MTQFSKSFLSNKTGECRRIAAQITEAGRLMGLDVRTEESRVSASHYVFASNADGSDEIKIRCSDHEDRHGGSDWHHWVDVCPSITIARLAAHFGCALPPRFTAEAYKARAAAALDAAQSRSAARRATESEMLDAVIVLLRAEKTAGLAVAGRVVDLAFPGITRAQRQRIANDASSTVIRERALSAAVGDEAGLLKLSTRYDEARSALADLVGPDRFASLRPAGYPRRMWRV